MIPLISVLFVDDEPQILELTELYMEQFGTFSIDTAYSASLALQKIQDLSYDAIVSDYQMPGMDGIEFLKTLRASGNSIPFIIFTGKGREEVVIEALNSGADFYLQKGGDLKAQFVELAYKIRQAVDLHKSAKALRESEERVRKKLDAIMTPEGDIGLLRLSDIIDVPVLQAVMDDFSRLTGAAVAIIETDGTILVASGWQEICTQFHRVHPKASKNCIESDTTLSTGVRPHEFRLYKCKNNMYDVVTPIIVGDHNLGNLFTGQLLLTDEPIDIDLFRRQAGRFGFDEAAYLSALDRVPRLSRERVSMIMEFNTRLAGLIADLSMNNIKMARAAADRERYLSSLQESKERYRNVVESQNEFICRFLPDGTHVFVNEAYCRYFGLDREVIIGTLFKPQIHPDDRAKVGHLFASLTPDNPVDIVDQRIIMPDGTIRWQRWSTRAIFDENGSIREYQSVGRDITEQKEMEKALRESEAYYRAIFENTGTASIIIEEDKTISLVNEEFTKLSGYSREEIEGKIIWPEFVVQDDLEQMLIQHQLRRKKPTQAKRRYEFRFKRKDGDIRTISLTVDVIPGTKKSIASLLDITDRKQAEENLKRANEEEAGLNEKLTSQIETIASQSQELHAAYEQLAATEEELLQNYKELEQGEIRVRESEERYRNVVEGQTEFICRFLPDGTHVFVNEAYCRYFGLDREAMIGSRFKPQIHPDDRRRLKEHIASLTPGHPVASLRHRIIMPDGTIHWQRWSDRAIFDDIGKVVEYQSVGRDITEIIEMEEEVQEEQQQYSTLIKLLPDPLLAIDRVGRVVAWNQAMEDLTGIPAEEMLGKGDFAYAVPFYGERRPILIDLMREQDEEVLNRSYSTIARENGTLVGETALPNFQGEKKVLWGKAAALYDAHGNYNGAIEVIRDITGRKYYENLYQGIMEHAGTAIIVFDREGTLLAVNTEAERLSGYPREETVGKKKWIDFVDPADRERLIEYQRLREEEPDQAPGQYEFRMMDRAGRSHDVILDVGTMQHPGHYVASLVEITERKKAEEALRQAHHQMQILTGITRHDILNNVMVADGYLSLIKGADPDEQEEYREVIHRTIQKIEDQIKFTRDFQDMGRTPPKWQGLAGIIDHYTATEPKFDQVCVDIQLGDLQVYADPMLPMIFANIMDNSLIHGEGISRLSFSAREVDRNLLIVCEDDGAGIPREEKEAIFQSGFGQNHGYGLFLVREILNLTGIGITETGTPGDGARFEIRVPPGGWRASDDK